MVTDSIADMLNRIKNASMVGHETVELPYSNLVFAIAKTLEKEGYITNILKKGKKATKALEFNLVYINSAPKMKGFERVSKSSKRVYFGVKEIMLVRSGFGSYVLSTPKGIMTGREARKERVGGEVLFKIW